MSYSQFKTISSHGIQFKRTIRVIVVRRIVIEWVKCKDYLIGIKDLDYKKTPKQNKILLL